MSKLKIEPGRRVTIEYTLRLEDGSVADTNVGGAPFTYTQGSGEMIPGLEKGLVGLGVGDLKEVAVQPDEGYGAVDPDAILEMSSTQVPAGLEVGAELQAEGPNGEMIRGRIAELRGETVLVDFNHELAGEVLYFTVRVLDVQEKA